jgi:hypothetical protein
LKGWKNKMNANEFAKQLEEELGCVVLHTKVDCYDEDKDDEMFIVLSPSASRVKMSFIVDLMENFVHNLSIQETSYYELDKYLKTINEIVKRK